MSQAIENVLSPAKAAPADRELFGQPRGLATLFLTEMWERLTYYGMRAVLILFMVASVADGGLGIPDKTASSIYGLYLAGTYVLSMLGGWIADRLIGGQKAVTAGGILIMAGNTCLAAGNEPIFFLGLTLNVLGVGLLKPNISAIVAQLYPEGGSRRDAGFSIFYMGINIGSVTGSVFVPLAAQRFGWHTGFALPAVGMLLGLVQFITTRHFLGRAGLEVAPDAPRGSWLPVIGFVAVVVLVAALALTGIVAIDAVAISAAASWVIGILVVAYVVYMVFFAGLERDERTRIFAMAALFAASTMFWAGFEQMGASFNLFADRYTDLSILGWRMPAGLLQGVNPTFIILLAPVFAALWINLGKRGADLSAPTKLGAGLLLLGAGFFVMYVASGYVLSGQKVSPFWLIATYFLHSCGELCLSPVGLSSTTKLAPRRFVGQIMGLWFISMALGNNLAGQFSGEYDATHLESLPGLFLKLFWWGAIGGGVMLLITPLVKRWMAGVR